LPRQERCRQLRVAQVDLAILVHEQRAQHEGSLARGFDRAGERIVERCEHLHEAAIAARQVAQVPAHGD